MPKSGPKVYIKTITPAAMLKSPAPTLATRSLAAAEVLVALAKAVLARRVPFAAMDCPVRVGRESAVVPARVDAAGGMVRVDPPGRIVVWAEGERVKATPEMVVTSGDTDSTVNVVEKKVKAVSSETVVRIDGSEGLAIRDELWARDKVDVGGFDPPSIVVGVSIGSVVVLIPP